MAKWIYHMLMLVRLHITFRHSMFEFSPIALRNFAIFASVAWVAQVCVWGVGVHSEVDIGETRNSGIMACTLFSRHGTEGSDHHVKYARVYFPICFGVIDSVINVFTLWLFISRLMHVTKKSKDPLARTVIRKLSVLSVVEISFTFFIYTLGMIFYPDAVMLLPIVAMVDSLAIFLVSAYAHQLYNWLCCPCDFAVMTYMKNTKREISSRENDYDLFAKASKSRSKSGGSSDRARSPEDTKEGTPSLKAYSSTGSERSVGTVTATGDSSDAEAYLNLMKLAVGYSESSPGATHASLKASPSESLPLSVLSSKSISATFERGIVEVRAAASPLPVIVAAMTAIVDPEADPIVRERASSEPTFGSADDNDSSKHTKSRSFD
jgi:hypothetical protein